MGTDVVVLALIAAIAIPAMFRVDFRETVLCLLVIAGCLAALDGVRIL